MNKTITLGAIISLILIITAFTKPNYVNNNEGPKNLKILPKDISEEELKQIMKGFNSALGVKCKHCHSPKENGEEGLNFSSDSNPNKNITRSMMKMTKKINKKYFTHPHEGLIQSITCETCHNGKPNPKTLTIK